MEAFEGDLVGEDSLMNMIAPKASHESEEENLEDDNN